MAIKRLGHFGVYVANMPLMVDFYSQVMGLPITDRDPAEKAVFFSSRPEEVHHEFVLVEGRADLAGGSTINQISWELESLEDLLLFNDRLKAAGVAFDVTCTHGIAFGIYFFDPEGNRSEVWWDTGRTGIPQPYRRKIDLNQSPEGVLAQAAALHAEDGF